VNTRAMNVRLPGRDSARTWAEFDPDGEEELPHQNLSGTAQGVYAHASKLMVSRRPSPATAAFSPRRVWGFLKLAN
jgi:hypothetical protein